MLNHWGIKQRVLLLAIAPAMTISLILGGYFTNIRLGELAAALNDRGTAVASKLATQAEHSMFTHSPESLRNLAHKELNHEISSVTFYTSSGIQVAGAGIPSTTILTIPGDDPSFPHISENEKYDTVSFVLPIIMPGIVINSQTNLSFQLSDANLKEHLIGWVKVEVDHKVTRLKEYQVLLHSALIMLLGFVISGLFASRLGSRVTEPILNLTRSIELIKQGKLDTKINIDAKWEIAILQSGMNTMVSSLRIAHEELQKNIGQATADLRNTLETIELQNIELEISRKEAEAASQVKSEFLASMSHELRTPLNGIIGFTNLLQKLDLTNRQKDYITTIQKSANSLLSIINDILDFSKIEAGKLHLDMESMSIHECVEDTLTLLAPSAHDKGLELIPFIYNDVPTQIIGDPLRIKQVITNLVSNAIKFTYTGSVIVRVMVETETTTTATLHISVQDTGIGMTEEQQAKLFNAFNQLDPEITKKFGGTGLGLVICKKLIEQMHGTIALESTHNQGSTFWFTLTVDKVTTPAILTEPPIFENINVILFEAHPITRLTIKHLLEKCKIKVLEVDNHLDIPKIVEAAYNSNQPFHLALLGINQPDPTSNFVTNIFNAIRYQYSCAIGVIANTTDHIVHAEILQAGVALCLAKPICRQKFYAALFDVFNSANKQVCAEVNDPSKIKILVVDDNNENLKLAAALLDNIGADSITVSSGRHALDIIDAIQFNMILMDIHMPVMDGIETSLAIRSSTSINKNTPIVALSANILLSEKSAIKRAKINDYLTKPINENQLRATIYKWTHSGTINKDIIKSSIKNYNKTPTTRISKKTKSIDWKLAKKLAVGNMDLAKDMLAMLIETLPTEKKTINSLYNANALLALHETVHRLHGACCYTGTPKLKVLLQKLDISLKTDDIAHLDTQIQYINVEIDNVMLLWQQEVSMA